MHGSYLLVHVYSGISHSVMQEHRSLNQASQRMEQERQLDSASTYNFWVALEIVALTFYKAIHKEAHLYRIVDKEAFTSFNVVR